MLLKEIPDMLTSHRPRYIISLVASVWGIRPENIGRHLRARRMAMWLIWKVNSYQTLGWLARQVGGHYTVAKNDLLQIENYWAHTREFSGKVGQLHELLKSKTVKPEERLFESYQTWFRKNNPKKRFQIIQSRRVRIPTLLAEGFFLFARIPFHGRNAPRKEAARALEMHVYRHAVYFTDYDPTSHFLYIFTK